MNNQRGNIVVEYLLATLMVLAIVFGVEVKDQSLWGMFRDAFQTRHNNYSNSINHLDDIDLLTDLEKK